MHILGFPTFSIQTMVESLSTKFCTGSLKTGVVIPYFEWPSKTFPVTGMCRAWEQDSAEQNCENCTSCRRKPHHTDDDDIMEEDDQIC